MTEPANKAGIVFFVDNFSWSKKKTPLQLDYDAIDKCLSDKSSFNEVLGFDTHCHLYFDFDSISNDEEYQDVFKKAAVINRCFWTIYNRMVHKF
ncbi:hypothetical protein M9Y10_040961 [Tritrichomonas musculus]|uniref:Uncharacterized protein n=1 Tax=Tritrichomonas musculus TaxID=1915356 RepID=A0ABR2K4V2_9EUKA